MNYKLHIQIQYIILWLYKKDIKVWHKEKFGTKKSLAQRKKFGTKEKVWHKEKMAQRKKNNKGASPPGIRKSLKIKDP